MKNEKQAYKKGYRVRRDGSVKGLKKDNLSLVEDTGGYYTFNCSINSKITKIRVHRLQAYQKFGDKIFEDKIEVRHLDGKNKNNCWDNIEIGTHSDNMKDASRNGKYSPKYPHKKIIKYYEENDCSHQDLVDEFDLSCRGVVSYILNNSIEAKKK